VVGPIDSATDWTEALAGVQVVVHLAARVHVMNDRSTDPLAEFRRTNVAGTFNLARQAVAAGVRRLVFISSVKVNGEATEAGHVFRETDVPDPKDAYGQSKFEAEQGLRHIANETSLELVIIRPPLVYGPGVKANFAALLRAVQRGWPLPLGAVHNLRSLVAIDNLTDFIRICMTHPDACNQTFLISDGQDLSTSDLIKAIAVAAHVRARLVPVPVWLLRIVASLAGRQQAVQRLCGSLQIDSSKARLLLGWTPVLTVQAGLNKAFEEIPE
jgi:UDP-glucose 4-epimerase